MEIKIARSEINGKPKTVDVAKLDEMLRNEGQKIFYFDKENSHKDMMNLIDHFESQGLNVYFREVRFGLDESEYMYEVHVL